MRYKKEQPRDGDDVLTCGHIKDGATHHFYRCPDGATAQGPTGPVPIKWLISCNECSIKADFVPQRIGWVDYMVWCGNEPCLVEETKH